MAPQGFPRARASGRPDWEGWRGEKGVYNSYPPVAVRSPLRRWWIAGLGYWSVMAMGCINTGCMGVRRA
jgi:hypothetical protein